MIRVLLWAPRGAGRHYDGMGLNARRMYKAAASGLFEVEIAHGRVEHGEFPCYHRQHLIAPLTGGWFSTARFLVKARAWLRANAARFDVMHCLNVFEVDVQPALWAEHLGLPVVMVPANHQAGLVPSGSPWRRVLGLHRRRRRAVTQVSALVAVSSHIEQELLSVGVAANRIHRIPFGVDTVRFHPVTPVARQALRDELAISRQFVILFAGEISDRKRPHWILPGLKRLVDAGVDAGLLLVGPIKDEGYWRHMQAEAVSMGVEERMDWRGYVPDVQRYHQTADVFVLPSKNEGLPNALLEAMASGLPAICTPISGCSDALADGLCGRLVEDAESLGAALSEYAANHELCVAAGLSARAKAERDYSMQHVTQCYRDLFQMSMAHDKTTNATDSTP